ncbi:MAG: type II toxin-antitoxin system RelE/ParE family toxin [Candidatus Marinimicrobia bacterium]|nr:type II toxin-antitoxin system RelE/ParE family toxin [Candidatus Neomarinimicrobiota bacterium]
MKYEIVFKPKSLKDCKKISKPQLERIFNHVEEMSINLKGDVKRLTNFTPEYRLRVGDYRILFEIDDNKIIIYRIRHRKEVYK